MTAYYNEIDPFKAAVLREAIKAGAIAPGDVDERSIADVRPNDLREYTQCHFFAGGGFWSLALRQVGWPDDRPVWTGSCPCQPFSCAGKGAGFDDERHVWPYWHHHIRVCKPAVVFGEQVGSKDGLSWLDLVQADMEGLDYAIGPVVTPAAGYGAPHGRHRLYFVAESDGIGSGSGFRDNGAEGLGWIVAANRLRSRLLPARMVESIRAGLERHSGNGDGGHEPRRLGETPDRSASETGSTSDMGHSAQRGWGECGDASFEGSGGHAYCANIASGVANSTAQRLGEEGSAFGRQEEWSGSRCGPGEIDLTGGFWRDPEWIPCRHPKIPGAIEWRPIKPGTFCLAHGSPSRVGGLRLYGDGIVVAQAAEFVKAYLAAKDEEVKAG